MGAHPRHRHLLKDNDVTRWYDNLARGSIITAEERLRRLGRFCTVTGLNPKALVDKKRASPADFDDFIMDYVDSSLKKDKPAQVRNNLITIKSWLGHFGLKIDKKINLPAVDFVEEVVPTREQLAQILRHCDARSRVVASLIAFCGLRPESIGNYLGTDGLRIGDLPELKLNSKSLEFETIPTRVIVRKTLSKARHQYFTFLPEEGCQYLREYLEARVRAGEALGQGSPIIAHVREGSRLPFLRTTKVAWEVKLAIKASGFSWRPYVLRSYCDTAFDIAESKGLISHPWRQFFMGHTGDIEARYSTNKTRLPPSMIEEMRESYKKCTKLLQTSGHAEEEDRDTSFRKVVLVGIGYRSEEVDKWDVANLSEEGFQAKVREKLLGKAGNPVARQKVVQTPEEARNLIGQGWELAGTFPNGDIVVKMP